MSGVLFLNPFYSNAQEGSPGHGLGDFNQTDHYTQGQQPTDGIGESHNEVITPKESTAVKSESKSSSAAKKIVVKPVEVKKEEPKEQTAATKTSNTTTNNSENVNNKENGESVLGFNVLYYMIQKFKFNDVNVIDQ